MYKTKEEAFRQLNFDLVVARAEKLMEQRNELVEQLYGGRSLESSDTTTSVQEPDVKRTVDPDEPKIYKEDKKHEFKIGDHVLVESGTENERTGKIIRLPMEGVDCPNAYVIDLDDKDLGWEAIVAIDGVDCENAWVASETNIELLEVNK